MLNISNNKIDFNIPSLDNTGGAVADEDDEDEEDDEEDVDKDDDEEDDEEVLSAVCFK